MQTFSSAIWFSLPVESVVVGNGEAAGEDTPHGLLTGGSRILSVKPRGRNRKHL